MLKLVESDSSQKLILLPILKLGEEAKILKISSLTATQNTMDNSIQL